MNMSDKMILSVRSYVESSRPLTVEELSQLINTPRTILERLLEEEIVRPIESDDRMGPRFSPEQVGDIERSLRLHEELGVNWAGVAIIQDLLRRVESLQHELDRKYPMDGDIRDANCEQVSEA